MTRPTGWWFRVETPGAQAIILLIAAFAIRCWQFGNAAIQIDEQFYLLVGDRLWHGLLPYVDIWDRKPFGLFLLYGAIRGLGGGGIIQYQIVATLFAAATAILVGRMALRIAPPVGALIAGLLYLLCLGMSGGDGGQAPVFYNLLVAGAALILLRVAERTTTDARLMVAGLGAMALMGVALQIKESCVFEGIYLGLALLWFGWRAGWGWPRLLLTGAMWAMTALLPSAAAWGFFAATGHGAAYVYANFQSVFIRTPESRIDVLGRLGDIAWRTVPLMVCGWLGWRWRPAATGPAHGFLLGWAVAAVLGVLLFGTYFDHYALPLYAPLCVIAAPVLARPVLTVPAARRRGVPVGVLLLIGAALVSVLLIVTKRHVRGDGSQQRAIAAFLQPRLHDCLFVYDGEPILYYLTRSCLPTRWAFPDHLSNRKENNSIGVDPLAEVRRVMATRPQFVVASDKPFTYVNWRTWHYMAWEMARDYRPVFAIRIGKRRRMVFERIAGR